MRGAIPLLLYEFIQMTGTALLCILKRVLWDNQLVGLTVYFVYAVGSSACLVALRHVPPPTSTIPTLCHTPCCITYFDDKTSINKLKWSLMCSPTTSSLFIYMYVYIYILFYKRFLCRPSVAARKVNETEGTNDSVRQCLQAWSGTNLVPHLMNRGASHNLLSGRLRDGRPLLCANVV